ncbi:hypothetical protein EGR_10125 [Echinococcus granulosus]|uniref:Uncharacterized protein n=1 Tax=Echinococcus granulosus TaxID=6210 RepID=W6U949_ECHGR|nr:hypothetical protein EGR_10125 [Echinococcus granulosus]EUB55007.1 hypothetical protein EGR_10125 [Echinococcus granulosus]
MSALRTRLSSVPRLKYNAVVCQTFFQHLEGVQKLSCNRTFCIHLAIAYLKIHLVVPYFYLLLLLFIYLCINYGFKHQPDRSFLGYLVKVTSKIDLLDYCCIELKLHLLLCRCVFKYLWNYPSCHEDQIVNVYAALIAKLKILLATVQTSDGVGKLKSYARLVYHSCVQFSSNCSDFARKQGLCDGMVFACPASLEKVDCATTNCEDNIECRRQFDFIPCVPLPPSFSQTRASAFPVNSKSSRPVQFHWGWEDFKSKNICANGNEKADHLTRILVWKGDSANLHFGGICYGTEIKYLWQILKEWGINWVTKENFLVLHKPLLMK